MCNFILGFRFSFFRKRFVLARSEDGGEGPQTEGFNSGRTGNSYNGQAVREVLGF